MYVDDQTYKQGNKTYRRVLLRTSYRSNGKVLHKTIASLSKHNEDEIRAIKWALKNKDKIKNANYFPGALKIKQGLSVGSVWLLYKIADRIGITKALGKTRFGKLCLLMVIANLIGHNSRLSIVRLARSHAFCDILDIESFNEDDLYLALNWLSKNQDVVENKLFQNRYKKAIPALYLYDVTSSYLEGDQNELGEYGFNRDGKKGKKQIVIGFLTDEEGCPISVQVFKGNTNDTSTFYDQVIKLKEKFRVEKVVIVGDRGMIKSAQIENLSNEEFNYITAITKPQIEKMLQKGIFQLGMFDENLVEIKDDDIRYVLRRNPIRVQEIAFNREQKYISLLKFVEKQNNYLSEHKKAKVDTALKRIEEKIKKLLIHKWINISIDERILKIEVDEEKKKKESLLDGCYVIKTDLSEEAATKDIIHSRYKDLAKVEWGFRSMKSRFIEMRGIFVRKEERTRAHVFTVMLSYLLNFYLYKYWQEIEITCQEGINELSSICSLNISYTEGIDFQSIPEPRKLGKLLLEKANVTIPDAIASRNIKVATRKKLVSERKIAQKA